jgi:hypothetical protein
MIEAGCLVASYMEETDAEEMDLYDLAVGPQGPDMKTRRRRFSLEDDAIVLELIGVHESEEEKWERILAEDEGAENIVVAEADNDLDEDDAEPVDLTDESGAWTESEEEDLALLREAGDAVADGLQECFRTRSDGNEQREHYRENSATTKKGATLRSHRNRNGLPLRAWPRKHGRKKVVWHGRRWVWWKRHNKNTFPHAPTLRLRWYNKGMRRRASRNRPRPWLDAA